MFTFDDLSRLDGAGLQVLLRAVEKDKLPLALKGASEKLREHVLQEHVGARGQDAADDIEALGPVRLRDVDEAQAGIVLLAKETGGAGPDRDGGRQGRGDGLLMDGCCFARRPLLLLRRSAAAGRAGDRPAPLRRTSTRRRRRRRRTPRRGHRRGRAAAARRRASRQAREDGFAAGEAPRRRCRAAAAARRRRSKRIAAALPTRRRGQARAGRGAAEALAGLLLDALDAALPAVAARLAPEARRSLAARCGRCCRRRAVDAARRARLRPRRRRRGSPTARAQSPERSDAAARRRAARLARRRRRAVARRHGGGGRPRCCTGLRRSGDMIAWR